ncbi:MAG: right-handed parallel beta-helix repeat-containing protein [Planctomycetota bacterium]
MLSNLFTAAILVFGLASHAFGQTVYVDLDATGANDGSSWADAFVDLQDALAVISVGEIWVAEGRYRPALAGQVTVAFQLKNQVEILGGFVGIETLRSQRDVALHETFLDGDLLGDDTYGAFANWWQFGWSGQLDNSGRIVDASGVDSTAVLDGFSIVAGYGVNAPSFDLGAGLFMRNGSPSIRNCTFRYNSYAYGASVYIDGGDPVFEGCTIKDGYTFARTASGVWLDNGSATFTDCDFVNHYTVTTGGRNDGSAFYGGFASVANFSGCNFIDNQIGNWFAQGDLSGSYGAAIYGLGDLMVDRCNFSGGFGNGGSAITAYNGLAVSNSRFFDNFARPYPINSFVDDGDIGASICIFSDPPVGMVRTIDSCTFVNNYCDKGAGIWTNSIQAVEVNNCILFFNDGPTALPGEDQTPVLKRQFVGKINLTNCAVEELWEKLLNEDPVESNAYPNCIDQSPNFVDWQNGDLHLLADSPCLNSGSNNLLPPGSTLGLDGASRVLGTQVDMGCYESSVTAQPSLAVTSIVTEVQSTFSVFNALPGETVFIANSFIGLGAGPVIPQLGGLQLDLLAPAALFVTATANASGHAIVTLTVPPTAPLVSIYFQAAIARGAGGGNSLLTNTDSQVIYLKP